MWSLCLDMPLSLKHYYEGFISLHTGSKSEYIQAPLNLQRNMIWLHYFDVFIFLLDPSKGCSGMMNLYIFCIIKFLSMLSCKLYSSMHHLLTSDMYSSRWRNLVFFNLLHHLSCGMWVLSLFFVSHFLGILIFNEHLLKLIVSWRFWIISYNIYNKCTMYTACMSPLDLNF